GKLPLRFCETPPTLAPGPSGLQSGGRRSAWVRRKAQRGPGGERASSARISPGGSARNNEGRADGCFRATPLEVLRCAAEKPAASDECGESEKPPEPEGPSGFSTRDDSHPRSACQIASGTPHE